MTPLSHGTLRGARRAVYQTLECPRTDGFVRRSIDRILLALILANAAAVLVDQMVVPGSPAALWLMAFECVSVAVFTVEYCCRVWVAVEHEERTTMPPWRARLAYCVSPVGLIDLVAILPFYFGMLLALDLRYLRILRLFRLLKLTRYSPALQSLAGAFYEERRSFAGAFIIVFVAWMTAATLMHLVERESEAFATLPDAMYWAIITLTTVGYGDVVPHTAAGKVIAGISALMGLCLFALPAGIVVSGFFEQIKRRDFSINAKLVAKVPLFAGLKVTHLVEISTLLRPLVVPPLYAVVRKGDPCDCMYFVLSGELEVHLPSTPLRLRSGEFFGEMGLLDLTSQVATVVARTDSQLLVLDEYDFNGLLRAYPEMRAAIEREAVRRQSPSLPTASV